MKRTRLSLVSLVCDKALAPEVYFWMTLAMMEVFRELQR
jgi:hypothetical protein